MVRPRKCRRIFQEPSIRSFKPDWDKTVIPTNSLEITEDELESVRLNDYEGFKQQEIGELMGVSQPTLNRILKSARKKISEALIKGKKIEIKGGNSMKNKYHCKSCSLEWGSQKKYEKCPECKSEYIYKKDATTDFPQMSNKARRQGTSMNTGHKNVFKCPKCGFELTKTPSIPCREFKCPKCETPFCGVDY